MPNTASLGPDTAHRSRSAPELRSSSVADRYPTLSARRFYFRPFRLADIGPLAALAGEHRIADTAIGIPHPYTMEFARMWIISHPAEWEHRRALHWAALRVGEDQIAGYGGLNAIDMNRGQAELRFWVGSGVERKKHAIEWAAAIVEFAWTYLNLHRVYALQLTRHPLSAHVLAAIGMHREGLVRKRFYRGGLVEDALCWAATREDSQPGEIRDSGAN